ncbi:hypothetical protein F5146DRAFT_1002590 [Armillaria mellea]|nr:hypothetical protein F5146DRAFT_1002590 [Armillaria mellea]
MTALNNKCVPQTPPSSRRQQNSSTAKSPLYTGHVPPSTPSSIPSSLSTASSLSCSDTKSIPMPEIIPHQTQGPVLCNDDDEYFSEPFFMAEELDGIDGLGFYALPVIPTSFKEDDPYIKATNDMKRNLLPGDSSTHGRYYVVLNGRTCGVHQGWDATAKSVLNFPSASFFRAESHSDTEESWRDAFLEDRVGPPGYQRHEPIKQEADLPPRTPPSSPHCSTARCHNYCDEYATPSYSALSSPSPYKAKKQSPFVDHPLNPSDIFSAPQSPKAGSSARALTSKSYRPTPGSLRTVPPLLRNDIWERVLAYWVVMKGRHPGVFHGISAAQQAGAEPNSVIKAAMAEQACMRFVQAFMDSEISQME